jgi:hypothetical protein
VLRLKDDKDDKDDGVTLPSVFNIFNQKWHKRKVA